MTKLTAKSLTKACEACSMTKEQTAGVLKSFEQTKTLLAELAGMKRGRDWACAMTQLQLLETFVQGGIKIAEMPNPDDDNTWKWAYGAERSKLKGFSLQI